MRKKIVAGNWKMNKLYLEAINTMEELKKGISDEISSEVEIIIFPPHLYIDAAISIFENSGIDVGAQNSYYKDNGAYTGEISPEMLKEIKCNYVLLGHSERRQIFGETNEIINLKVLKALEYNLKPILCFGETLHDRDEGKEKSIVNNQISSCLKNVCAVDMNNIIIAYEPVWAIGTGKTATPAQADEMHCEIRNFIKGLYNSSISDKTRILYGGSVNEKNSKELFGMKDIDGGLIGGASLSSASFIKIIESAV